MTGRRIEFWTIAVGMTLAGVVPAHAATRDASSPDSTPVVLSRTIELLNDDSAAQQQASAVQANAAKPEQAESSRFNFPLARKLIQKLTAESPEKDASEPESTEKNWGIVRVSQPPVEVMPSETSDRDGIATASAEDSDAAADAQPAPPQGAVLSADIEPISEVTPESERPASRVRFPLIQSWLEKLK